MLRETLHYGVPYKVKEKLQAPNVDHQRPKAREPGKKPQHRKA